VIDSREALEAVIRHAAEFEDYDDIASSVTALAASGNTTLVPRLHEALNQFLDEENFYGRDLLAGILAGIQGTAALPVLLRASARDLADDQDSLQTEIIELMHADRATSRRAVLELATSETPELRRVGLWALEFVVEAQDVELLAAAATDADPTVRSIAIDSIPDPVGNDQAFDVLVLALGDLNEQIRISAISRLASTGRAEALAPLVTLAADQTPRTRSMVAYALGRLRRAEAAPALLRLLHDPEPHVRDHAAQALGSVGGPAAIDALLMLAANEDPQLRVQAAKALAQAAVNSDDRATQRLRELAHDDTAAVRAATLGGLASTASGSSNWAPLVLELANDPNPTVRQRVAIVARHLAPDAASDILHHYTSDQDQTLRRIATTELNRLTDPTDH
jgi:HEAT repeat protein